MDNESDSHSYAAIMRDSFNGAVNKDAEMLNANNTNASDSDKVYIVSCQWMINLMKYIHESNESSTDADADAAPGKMMIAPLLQTDDDTAATAAGATCANSSPSSSTTDDRTARRERWSRIKETKDGNISSASLKKGLKFGQDYTLVGEGLWTLLSSKFGYDDSLQFEIGWKKGDKDMSMYMAGTETGLIGGSTDDNNNDTSSGDKKVVKVVDEVVLLPQDGKIDYSRIINANSSGDDNDGLVSEDGSAIDDTANASSPILLLPPSTTSLSLNGAMVLDQNSGNSALSDDDDDDNSAAIKTRKRKRYGSGLGNLGNTCFMNSTLQCLAHTGPLRSYFLSGQYARDLNRENPLGTGGELATEFANLLMEMWGTGNCAKQDDGNTSSRYGGYRKMSWGTSSSSSSPVVYPRNFKDTLGKHAEQFIGYNQHDSQELATYLLDALHEDTNRVTKKPYFEKPEQGEDENDEEAASKAWDLHLKREDSKVLESFMGQVKSRVECPRKNCGRVSTTFDPFMYLSVPLPGTSETTFEITYVSMTPGECMTKLNVTLSKTANVKELQKKIAESVNESKAPADSVDSNDIAIAEVWHNEIYSYYNVTDDVSKIGERDDIYAFQLASVESIHEEQEQDENDSVEQPAEESQSHTSRLKLDLANLTKLNQDWENGLSAYLTQTTTLPTLLNSRRKTHEDRMNFHKKLTNFINRCHASPECAQAPQSDVELDSCDDDSTDGKMSPTSTVVSKLGATVVDDDAQSLEELCETSSMFKAIKTSQDVAILEFCSNKFYQASVNMVKEKKLQYQDGAEIQINFRKPGNIGRSDSACGTPIILRISPNLTVYGLRKILAERLSRVMNCGDINVSSSEDTKEEKSSMDQHMAGDAIGFLQGCSEELRILRQVPLTYERKNSPHSYSSSYSSKSGSYRKLGSIADTESSTLVTKRHVTFAMPSDESEKESVLDHVGNGGRVQIHFPTKYSFDDEEWDKHECQNKHNGDGDAKDDGISILDCIRKYCQIEQLEETEMWFCSECKEHVPAWKQFHLYRAPPILIVHLKRFHYSPLTHRRDKIDALVDFPLKGLDLTKEVMHWEDKKDNKDEPIYDCYAVSNHFGGLGGGHYTAYALNDEEEWCNFDDSRVTTNVDEKEVVSSAAYVLYYRRRDVKNDDDVWTDRPMPTSLVPSAISSLNSSRTGRMEIEGDIEVTDDVGDGEESDMLTSSTPTSSSPMIGSISSDVDVVEDEEMDTASEQDA